MKTISAVTFVGLGLFMLSDTGLAANSSSSSSSGSSRSSSSSSVSSSTSSSSHSTSSGNSSSATSGVSSSGLLSSHSNDSDSKPAYVHNQSASSPVTPSFGSFGRSSSTPNAGFGSRSDYFSQRSGLGTSSVSTLSGSPKLQPPTWAGTHFGSRGSLAHQRDWLQQANPYSKDSAAIANMLGNSQPFTSRNAHLGEQQTPSPFGSRNPGFDPMHLGFGHQKVYDLEGNKVKMDSIQSPVAEQSHPAQHCGVTTSYECCLHTSGFTIGNCDFIHGHGKWATAATDPNKFPVAGPSQRLGSTQNQSPWTSAANNLAGTVLKSFPGNGRPRLGENTTSSIDGLLMNDPRISDNTAKFVHLPGFILREYPGAGSQKPLP